jgi:hypothetical protein
MTSKEIALAVGKPERTVQNWVKFLGAKLASVGAKLASSSPMKPADYDLEETIAIIEHGMGKNAAALYRESARQPATASLTVSEDIFIRLVDRITGRIVAAIEPLIQKHLPAMLPAPEISVGDQIRRLVNIESARSGRPQDQVWKDLYQDAYYRLHVNLRERAKNAKSKTVLEYAIENGFGEQLLGLALNLFRGSAA